MSSTGNQACVSQLPARESWHNNSERGQTLQSHKQLVVTRSQRKPNKVVACCVTQLVDTCRKADFTDMVIVQETRGEPGILITVIVWLLVDGASSKVANTTSPWVTDCLIVSHLPYGPTAYFSIANCVMRHDIPDRVRPLPTLLTLGRCISSVTDWCRWLTSTTTTTPSQGTVSEAYPHLIFHNFKTTLVRALPQPASSHFKRRAAVLP